MSLSAFTPQFDVILLKLTVPFEHTVTHEHRYMHACTCHHCHTRAASVEDTHTDRVGVQPVWVQNIGQNVHHNGVDKQTDMRERERGREKNKHACRPPNSNPSTYDYYELMKHKN